MVRSRAIAALATIMLLAPICSAIAAPEDLDALLDGVEAITAPGCVPGPVAVFGDQAFVVMSAESGSSRLAMIGAATFGQGRVVVGGHEGLLSALGDRADNLRLVGNIIRWLAGPSRAAPRVGLCDFDGIATPLKNAGFAVTEVPAIELPQRLGQLDVLIASLPQLDGPEDAARLGAVRDFVSRGGGLLTAVCPWGWMQITGKSLTRDLGGNLLLAEMGLVVSDGMVEPTAPGGAYAADRVALDLCHAGLALAALEAHVDGRGPLNNGDLAQASTTVSTAARAMPPADTVFLPRLAALCSRPEGRCEPTPDAPVTTAMPLARIAATLYVNALDATPVEDIQAHPSAAAFPGAVPDDAERVTSTLTIDTSVPDWHSTGLYAAPGELIRVSVPQDAVRRGLTVRIGCHTDGLWHLDKWQRFPEISRQFGLDATTTPAANPFGGLIYIVVPEGCKLGTIDVVVENAVRAPLYIHGKTGRSEWRHTIRGCPAPWAELATDKVIITVPSTAIRDLDDPERLMDFWDHVMECCSDLAATPRERERPERYVPDVQISAGYMHSGYPIMTWLDVADLSVSRDRLVREGSWGHFHEMGHNHQSGDWTFDGAGEVTENLFSLYISERACDIQGPPHPAVEYDKMQERLKQHLAKGAPFGEWRGDPFLALHTYVQIVREFGWGAISRVFAAYRAAPEAELPRSDDEKRDQWMVRLSREVGRNLGPFFDAWGIPISEQAKQSVSDLPPWMPADWPG